MFPCGQQSCCNQALQAQAFWQLVVGTVHSMQRTPRGKAALGNNRTALGNWPKHRTGQNTALVYLILQLILLFPQFLQPVRQLLLPLLIPLLDSCHPTGDRFDAEVWWQQLPHPLAQLPQLLMGLFL